MQLNSIRRIRICSLILIATLSIEPILLNQAEAKGNLDVMFGFYSLSAKTSRESASISGVGAYQLAYRYPFARSLEMLFGYSLIASKTISGDLGFGPDIGMVYYPFTSAAPIIAVSENVQFQSKEFYKPYVGGAFHQRQFQSTQSTYAGFSIAIGSLYAISNEMTFKAEVRLMQLNGPSQSTATETDMLFGLSFSF